jgi:hypothetical protein
MKIRIERIFPMRRIFLSAAGTALATALATLTALSAQASTATRTDALSRLTAQVSIPYERFVLPNGLTVIVHTDRKAPVVGVTVYYKVGSRDEPRGHAGFAHLYEHLFFLGSAHAPAFTAPLKAAGSITPNGSTYYDRTNYVETVPTGALDLALFLESDRMGWLLPALTRDKLDRQRGVVENEKRQNDNQPYGLMHYAVTAGLFPPGHPIATSRSAPMPTSMRPALAMCASGSATTMGRTMPCWCSRAISMPRPRGPWWPNGSAPSRAGLPSPMRPPDL